MKDIFQIEESYNNLRTYFQKIADKFENYEERKSQKIMIMNILKGYEENKHVIVEAPTGTGKSMAYILAFLSLWEQFSLENKPKLVVSTKTIPLQEQLINKDIPMLQDILDINFSAVLVKGRSNYICNRKMDDILNKRKDEGWFDSKEEAQEFNELKKLILDGNGELVIGDKSEIKTSISNSLWDKICSEADNCLKKKCEYNNECFFYKAREKQKASDILIVNHALFFSDLKVRMDTGYQIADLVLPEFNFVVLDEAHHIEDVASDFLGLKVSRFRYKRLTNQIRKAILYGDFSNYYADEEDTQVEVKNLCSSLDFMIDDLFQKIAELAGNNSTKRLSEKDIGFTTINYIENSFKRLEQIIRINKNKNSYTEAEEMLANSFIDRIDKLVTETKDIIDQTMGDYAYWIECPLTKTNRHYFASLNCCPISIAEVLRDNLFDRIKSIVLTSATMSTTPDDMSYIASRIGINNYLVKTLPSPFDYKEQSRIYIPQKALNPKERAYEVYLEDEIKNIIENTKGSALVLFTSYRLMNSLSDKMQSFFDKHNITFLKQGDLPRSMLLQMFKEDTSSVLFATASYWEGIDIPGEALSCVIITKLPFEVPDRPIIEARMEKLTKEGKNPFVHYQVPMAIMRFKQGFGRLIRTNTDKGVVAVLDNRLITMNYGKQFIRSLPLVPLTREVNEIKKILSK